MIKHVSYLRWFMSLFFLFLSVITSKRLLLERTQHNRELAASYVFPVSADLHPELDPLHATSAHARIFLQRTC